MEENIGWNATLFMVAWCDSKQCRGDLGSQEAGSWLRFEREVGVALSSSDCSAPFRASSSIIWDWVTLDVVSRVAVKPGNGTKNMQCKPTFFCKRTTLVHFFSSSDSYFFATAASKTSFSRLNSVLSVAAVSEKSLADRYAMIDLCLESIALASVRSPTSSSCNNLYTHSSPACRFVNRWLMLENILIFVAFKLISRNPKYPVRACNQRHQIVVGCCKRGWSSPGNNGVNIRL